MKVFVSAGLSVYNTFVLGLVRRAEDLSSLSMQASHGNLRHNDVGHWLADISEIRSAIRFGPQALLDEGLQEYIDLATIALQANYFWLFRNVLVNFD